MEQKLTLSPLEAIGECLGWLVGGDRAQRPQLPVQHRLRQRKVIAPQQIDVLVPQG